MVGDAMLPRTLHEILIVPYAEAGTRFRNFLEKTRDGYCKLQIFEGQRTRRAITISDRLTLQISEV